MCDTEDAESGGLIHAHELGELTGIKFIFQNINRSYLSSTKQAMNTDHSRGSQRLGNSMPVATYWCLI